MEGNFIDVIRQGKLHCNAELGGQDGVKESGLDLVLAV